MKRVAYITGLAGIGIVAGVVLLLAIAFLIPAEVDSFETVRSRWQSSEAWLLDRNGVVIDRQRIDHTFRRFEWTSLDAVSPALVAAVVDGEDRHFWEHRGVDWTAVIASLVEHGAYQRKRGASTISMQLAKHLDPTVRAGRSPGSLRRKFEQARLARTLESHWEKRQILEAYLNIVTFRGELQGVDAASRVLAGKAPSGLTLAESIVLAALLPSPSASASAVVSRGCARAAALRVSVACEEIRRRGTQMLEASDRTGRDASPDSHQAPHLARVLLNQAGLRVRTTLDADIQRMANNVLRQHVTALTSRNVRDGAVLVVDNASGEVLAYVGSAGATSRAQEVDGVRARRQAGSTLKPFLYELAIERGYLNAASLLNDAPVALNTPSGTYIPQNYDRDFKGLVSVRTALGNSLNVPAVRTIVLTGVDPLRDRLSALGYGISQPGDFYGYALALGSPEVSLWEQVQAYRTLARGGKWSEITFHHPGARATGAAREVEVLSPPASFIVADMMSDRAARTLTFGLDNYLNTPFWSAVKTGTSKDMRDNWCIGFTREYTVGVWIGNFEGDSMHDVTGVTGAAPIWNEIVLALHANRPSPAPEVPAGVVAARTRFSPSIEPARREFFLGNAPAAAVPTAPAEERAVHAVAMGGEIARIASPANGMVIAIDPDIPPAFQRVPLSANGVSDGMVMKLNGAVVGKATGKVLWSPKPGTHVLAIEDREGRMLDTAKFVVR